MYRIFIFSPLFILSIFSCTSVNGPESTADYELDENVLEYNFNSETNIFYWLEIREMCDSSGLNCDLFEITSDYSYPEFSFNFNKEGILNGGRFVYDRKLFPGFAIGDTLEILNIDYGLQSSQDFTNFDDPNYYKRYFVANEFTDRSYEYNTLRKLEFRLIKNKKIIFHFNYEE